MQACRCDPKAYRCSSARLLTDKETASMPDNLTDTLADDDVPPAAVIETSCIRTRTLPELPLEIKALVMDHLPLASAFPLGQVSRSWRAAVASKEYWELRLKQMEWRVKRKNSMPIAYLGQYRFKYRLTKSELPDRQYTPLIIEGIAFAKRGGPPGVTEAYIKLDHLKAERRQQIDQALKEKGIDSTAIVCIVDGDNVPKFKETCARRNDATSFKKLSMPKALFFATTREWERHTWMETRKPRAWPKQSQLPTICTFFIHMQNDNITAT
ncbi:hypothetical protein HDU88_001613 [Geranomyces variabilis]|nr:hypothetical protein HDU88_001613 [Geranomyces variabilis]